MFSQVYSLSFIHLPLNPHSFVSLSISEDVNRSNSLLSSRRETVSALNSIDTSLFLLSSFLTTQIDLTIQQEKKILSLEQRIDLMAASYSKPLTRILKDQITSEKIELEREAYKLEKEFLACRQQLDHQIALRLEAEKRAAVLASQLKNLTNPSASSARTSVTPPESFLAPKSMHIPTPSTDHTVKEDNPFLPKKKRDAVQKVDVSASLLSEMDHLEEEFAGYASPPSSLFPPPPSLSSSSPSHAQSLPSGSIPRGVKPQYSPHSGSPVTPPQPSAYSTPPVSSNEEDSMYMLHGVSSNLKRRFLYNETPFLVTSMSQSQTVRFVAEKVKEISDLMRRTVTPTFSSNFAAFIVGICDAVIHLSSVVSNLEGPFYSVLHSAAAIASNGSDFLSSFSSSPLPLPSIQSTIHPHLVEILRALKAMQTN